MNLEPLKKLYNALDVEAPFKKAGAPETGLAVKTYYSVVEAENIKGDKVIKELNKPKLSPEDYQRITFLAYTPRVLDTMPSNEQAKFRPLVKEVRKYFDLSAEELKNAGIIAEGFPQSLVRRLTEETKQLKNILKTDIPEKRRIAIDKQVAENDATIKFVNDSDLQFVPIPVKLWFRDMVKENEVQIKKIMSQYFKQRNTVDLQSLADYLIEKKVITPEDLDVRRVVAAYSHTKGLKVGLAKILRNAVDEGLARPIEDAPENFQLLPSRIAPDMAGMKWHPAFVKYIEDNFLRQSIFPETLGRVFSYIKIMQFINPVFLPAYDLQQAFWLGSVRDLNTIDSFSKGIKSYFAKDETFIAAMENGAFSKPFLTPFDKHIENVDTHLNDNTIIKKVLAPLKAKNVVKLVGNVVDSIYHLSWDLAWGADQAIRMAGVHHLLSKGSTIKEASQVVAQFHGDYASVPPATKAVLNRIFFTPTFKIVMTKLHAKMATEAAKMLVGKGGKESKTYAAGLVALAALWIAQDLLFKHWGFNIDETGYRYTKEIDTDKGPQTLVVTVPNPSNLITRYISKLKRVSTTEDKLDKILSLIPFNPHPINRWVIGMMSNKDENFKPIINPFGTKLEQSRDMARYSLRTLVRITQYIDRPKSDEDRKAALSALRNEIGYVADVMQLFTFPYIRATNFSRFEYEVGQLRKSLNEQVEYQIEYDGFDEETFDKWNDVFMGKVDKLKVKYGIEF